MLTQYRTASLFLDPPLFWEPEIKGLDGIDAPSFGFLISHEKHGQTQHVLFDLAVRKDWENYSPAIVKMITQLTRVRVDNDIAEILDSNTNTDECPVRSDDIDAIIWSHHHFDHVGDPSTFPSSTDLVVGPGVTSACWPGYPTNPDAKLLDSDIRGRTVREVDLTPGSPGSCQIGRFNALDYFGDGSFYLLDAPGHCLGHMCALARVTAGDGDSSDSFVLMGGDACHHAGLLRPSEYLPLDASLPNHQSLLEIHPKHSPTEPFMTPSPAMFPQLEQANETIRKIQELDAADNVFVILPHDGSLVESIPLFPRPINDWMERGLGNSTRWLFCRDFPAI